MLGTVSAYANATRRLLVLGVGGTFLNATGTTANDVLQLSSSQCALLKRLVSDPLNTVVLVSGRSRARMDELMAPVEGSGYTNLDGATVLHADAEVRESDHSVITLGLLCSHDALSRSLTVTNFLFVGRVIRNP